MLLSLSTAGCPQDIGFAGGPPTTTDDDPNTEDPYWCCDPDNPECVCPGYWRCTEGFEGKVCRQSNPPLPDEGGDGAWVCEYGDDLITCEGRASEHPDAGADAEWTCIEDEADDSITCERAATPDDYPDEGAGGPWDCSFSSANEARACREGGEQDEGVDDGSWDCMTGADGRTVCSNDQPERPDDGEWRCFRREDGADVCEGDHLPDEGVGWDCEEAGEVVVCEKADGQLPDTNGEGAWDCTWNEIGVRCHDNPGGGGDVGGEGEGEGEGEGDVPDDGGGGGGGEGGGGDGPADDCECIAGARRFCDEPDYCLWGTQECQEWFGQREWGPCEETNIPAGCAPGGALARDYAWNFAGGFWDNWQTRMYDADGDGILVYPPDYWFNPAGQDCAIRSGECAQDMWDFDQDGDNLESMGDCADIQECV